MTELESISTPTTVDPSAPWYLNMVKMLEGVNQDQAEFIEWILNQTFDATLRGIGEFEDITNCPTRRPQADTEAELERDRCVCKVKNDCEACNWALNGPEIKRYWNFLMGTSIHKYIDQHIAHMLRDLDLDCDEPLPMEIEEIQAVNQGVLEMANRLNSWLKDWRANLREFNENGPKH